MITSLPLPDTRFFRSAERRTRLVRAVLALALIGTLAGAFLLSRGSRVDDTLLPGGTSPVVVLDLSWSTSSSYRQIERTLGELASSGRRLGLVVFSDVAYEMLPAGTPAVELRSLLRFFSGPRSRRAASPWAASLSGGTRISAGLLLGREVLRRDRIRNGSVVLVSDLGDAPNDRTQLTAAVLSYLHDGIPLRVVGIEPTAENERFFQGLLGTRPLQPRVSRGPAVTESTSSSGLPLALVVVAALFLVLLAVNEHACARLVWGRSTSR